jgi:hypothetical protein
MNSHAKMRSQRKLYALLRYMFAADLLFKLPMHAQELWDGEAE